MLSVGYTPAGTSAKYGTIWTDTSAFDTTKTHNIALAWDTTAGNNANKLQMWYVPFHRSLPNLILLLLLLRKRQRNADSDTQQQAQRGKRLL